MINTAKERMQAGQPSIGLPVGLGSFLSAEAASAAGFDFVLVDNQHGNWTDDRMMMAFRSIALGPAVPMARVQKNDFYTIGRALDRGALGIVVPMVNSVEDAEAAAFAVRYPPRGGRSVGAFGAGLHGQTYYDHIDDEVFLAVQIETKQAAAQAEAILSVEGVDGCWIGPADLGRSLGLDLTSEKGHEAHEAAILGILAACRRAGKIPGIAGGGEAGQRLEQGFLFVTTLSDQGLVTQAMEETVRAMRDRMS
jgi:4-hydroxy-2-oxoheptanedioate aldolase